MAGNGQGAYNQFMLVRTRPVYVDERFLVTDIVNVFVDGRDLVDILSESVELEADDKSWATGMPYDVVAPPSEHWTGHPASGYSGTEGVAVLDAGCGVWECCGPGADIEFGADTRLFEPIAPRSGRLGFKQCWCRTRSLPSRGRASEVRNVRWNHFQDILPVLTLAIGYAGTFVTERFRDRNEERRARGSAIQSFERSVLLDTQAALYQYAGEMQDFAYALRGQSDRSYRKVVGTSWRASAQLEMLTTRVSGAHTRDALGEVLAAGQAIASGSWPNEDDWSDDDRALLDKAVDALLECEQRAALLLGDRLRTLTYTAPCGG